jgi:hypothetical protein
MDADLALAQEMVAYNAAYQFSPANSQRFVLPAMPAIELPRMPILPDGMEPCGKVWFFSKGTAEREMEHMKSIRGPEFELNAYYCYGCDGHHIGHTRIQRKKKK